MLPWFLTTFNNPNAGLLGLVSALYNIGGAIGAIYAFLLGDKMGRKKTLIGAAVFAAVGAAVQASSKTTGQLLVGRIFTGIGVGALTSTVGIWQAETAPPAKRGMYMALELCGITVGLFLSQWINYGFANYVDQTAFIFPLAFQLVFIVPMGLLFTILPESPRWLIKHGRQEEALAILVRLTDRNATAHDELVQKRFQDILAVDELEGKGVGWLRAMFTNGPTRNMHRVGLACGKVPNQSFSLPLMCK